MILRTDQIWNISILVTNICDWIWQNLASIHRATFGDMAMLSNNCIIASWWINILKKWSTCLLACIHSIPNWRWKTLASPPFLVNRKFDIVCVEAGFFQIRSLMISWNLQLSTVFISYVYRNSHVAKSGEWLKVAWCEAYYPLALYSNT